MTAVYNENDPAAAATLRELIANGLIAPGVVDERSIKDIQADDYRLFTQVHLFAGIGIWSHAARRAGWSDARPVLTGSCPCQPFSAAGLQAGFDDPRHLWPDMLRLVVRARELGLRWADRVFGEQVATAGIWLDLVRSDLEAIGHAFGSPDLPAAGFSGAHIRQRLYWVADADHAERWADLAPRHDGDWPQAGRIEGYGEPGASGPAGGVANAYDQRWNGGDEGSRQTGGGVAQIGCSDGWLAVSDGGHACAEGLQRGGQHGQLAQDRVVGVAQPLGDTNDTGSPIGSRGPDERGAVRVQGPAFGASGSLRGCDWLLCSDDKIRPVESGTFPLAATHPGRVGLLRGYGNALDAEVATNFIAAYMEAAGIAA